MVTSIGARSEGVSIGCSAGMVWAWEPIGLSCVCRRQYEGKVFRVVILLVNAITHACVLLIISVCHQVGTSASFSTSPFSLGLRTFPSMLALPSHSK